jgi:hypothetical protein
MMTAPLRRSAGFINKLTKQANAQATLVLARRADTFKATIEARRHADLEYVYKYLEGSARQGAVRVSNWEWSTPQKIRDLIFKDKEIRSYLESNGFMYDGERCVEWYHASTKGSAEAVELK